MHKVVLHKFQSAPSFTTVHIFHFYSIINRIFFFRCLLLPTLICVNRSFTALKRARDSLAEILLRIYFIEAWKSRSFI